MFTSSFHQPPPPRPPRWQPPFRRLKRWVFGGGLLGSLVGGWLTDTLPNPFLWLKPQPPITTGLTLTPGATPAAPGSTRPGGTEATPAPAPNLRLPEPPPAEAVIACHVDYSVGHAKDGWLPSHFRVRLEQVGGKHSATFAYCRWEFFARDGSVIIDRLIKISRPLSVSPTRVANDLYDVDPRVIAEFNTHHLTERNQAKWVGRMKLSFLGSDALGRPVETASERF